MVEQLGFAMILFEGKMASGLTSGTTKGTFGSMRQALELSMTTVPLSANFGAHSKLTLPPALNNAISGLAATAWSRVITGIDFPLKVMLFPMLLADAAGKSSVTGKFLSSRICNIFVPTNPVAPTTAIFMVDAFELGYFLQVFLAKFP